MDVDIHYLHWFYLHAEKQHIFILSIYGLLMQANKLDFLELFSWMTTSHKDHLEVFLLGL